MRTEVATDDEQGAPGHRRTSGSLRMADTEYQLGPIGMFQRNGCPGQRARSFKGGQHCLRQYTETAFVCKAQVYLSIVCVHAGSHLSFNVTTLFSRPNGAKRICGEDANKESTGQAREAR